MPPRSLPLRYECQFARRGVWTEHIAYGDNIAYNTPFGTPIATSATNIKAPGVYMAPDTPQHAFNGPIPINGSVASNRNDTGITKIQYTYALSQSAYLRAYGYTFYSDWMELSPMYGAEGVAEYTPSATAAQYQLITHTSGGALDFQDQLNDQNLVTIDGNYTTAGVIRFNNSSAYSGCLATCGDGRRSATWQRPATATRASTRQTVSRCRAWSTATTTWAQKRSSPPGSRAARKAGRVGSLRQAVRRRAQAPRWDSLWSGNANGSYNAVKPEFSNFSLADQWRPSDKFLLNAAVRYDNFTYGLPNTNTPANQFYANMSANYVCVNAATNEVLNTVLNPGTPPPAPAQYVVGDCNQAVDALQHITNAKGWVHPNGTTQDGVAAPSFTATSPTSYTLNYWQPRFSATYTLSPDTVIRASAGRFTQPPISASVQYTSSSGDDRSVWNNTMNLGFYSPFHPIPGISSAQYDLSLEQHLRGTDMSFKLTPFFTWVNDWQQQTFIGAGFVTQVPVGVNRDRGVEFQFNKGDFTRNGLSGQLAFTYTDSKIMFQNVPLSGGGVVTSSLTTLNQVIAAYNALTKAGGGSPCYVGTNPVSCNKTTSGGAAVIYNPYYNQPEQGLLNPSAWYNPFSTAIAPSLNGGVGSYVSPIVSSLLLNYRHDKLAITPSISFQTGGFYGSPLDTNGVDPRVHAKPSHLRNHEGISEGEPAAVQLPLQ